jgi:hypothetical protein
MDSELVERPKASNQKVTTSENFELCYLRHQYFRRVSYNPSKEEMGPYFSIVSNLSKKTFFGNYGLFRTMGMNEEDLFNIGNVHLVSFLGLYSLEKSEKRMKEWQIKFVLKEGKDPLPADFIQKNKANFTMFFKQRMEDLVRICRQKSRNVKGQSPGDYTVFCGQNKPPKYPMRLLQDYQELGYKKIDFSVFKSIRKKADVDSDATMFPFDNKWYVAIAIDKDGLELEDLIASDYNPYDNVHNMQPDVFYEEKESESLIDSFNGNTDSKKRSVLKNFIAKNKNDGQYRKEIVVAKKLLKTLGG